MRILAVLALTVLTALLAACDPSRVAKLEEGVSTENEVRKQFGDPVTITQLADGSRVLEYPRQPEGWTNYRIVIGADGKMSSLRQLLNEDNFARIQPGIGARQVGGYFDVPEPLEVPTLMAAWAYATGWRNAIPFASTRNEVSRAIVSYSFAVAVLGVVALVLAHASVSLFSVAA